VKVRGQDVVINSSGQLGVVVSSERFKTAIAPMGSNTAKLQQLRPVIFKLKTDTKGTLQYGLIAEEVAKVYPDLVVRDQKGRIDGVRYDELAPMLLNEMQQQKQTIAAQSETITEQSKKSAAQDERIAAQGAQLRDMQQQLAEMHAALLMLQSKGQLVAQR
jgi:trimeric autotransporter adhesin